MSWAEFNIFSNYVAILNFGNLGFDVFTLRRWNECLGGSTVTGAERPDEFVEKIAQNVAQPVSFVKIYAFKYVLNRGKIPRYTYVHVYTNGLLL
jgi:hypothetical protein